MSDKYIKLNRVMKKENYIMRLTELIAMLLLCLWETASGFLIFRYAKQVLSECQLLFRCVAGVKDRVLHVSLFFT